MDYFGYKYFNYMHLCITDLFHCLGRSLKSVMIIYGLGCGDNYGWDLSVFIV